MVLILGSDVGITGYGLLGLTRTARTDPYAEEEAFSAMKAAITTGAVFWNGGEFYGPPHANSLHLLNKYFTKYPEDASKVVLSIKGGIDMVANAIDASPEGIRRSVNNCVSILGSIKKIDIWECGRVDPKVPIETTIGTLAELVKEGKIGGIGLSEAGPETIRRAQAVHPIAAVEVEISLWSTDAIDKGITATCAELGIPIVAYSPIGRGFLSGQVQKPEDLDSRLRQFPRFQPEAFVKNLELVEALKGFAQKKGCTPAQLAISWVRNLSGKPGMPQILPIPGATKAERVIENAQHFALTEEGLKELEQILAGFTVTGTRYPAVYMKWSEY